MLSFTDAFKGPYLKCPNLHGKPKRLHIRKLGLEEVGDDKKIVMRFHDCDQALVLNKTNASVLNDAWGDDMESWVGRTVELRPDKTTYQGKPMDCIRVAAVPPVAKAVQEDDVNF